EAGSAAQWIYGVPENTMTLRPSQRPGKQMLSTASSQAHRHLRGSQGPQFEKKDASRLQFADNFSIVEDMRKREHLGQLELMVLFAVIQPGKESYGVQISREIAEKSGREVALA